MGESTKANMAMERVLTALVLGTLLACIIVVSLSKGPETANSSVTSVDSSTQLASSGPNIKLTEYSWDRSTQTLPDGCGYELSALPSIVPDACCDPSQGATQTDSWTTTQNNICTARPLGSAFIRDWAGCYTDSDGKKVPAMAELCIPKQYSFGTTYPMSQADATAPGVQGDFTLDQCLCGQLPSGNVPTTYVGVGCHAAVSPYMLGAGGTTAFFAKVEGSC